MNRVAEIEPFAFVLSGIEDGIRPNGNRQGLLCGLWGIRLSLAGEDSCHVHLQRHVTDFSSACRAQCHSSSADRRKIRIVDVNLGLTTHTKTRYDTRQDREHCHPPARPEYAYNHFLQPGRQWHLMTRSPSVK